MKYYDNSEDCYNHLDEKHGGYWWKSFTIYFKKLNVNNYFNLFKINSNFILISSIYFNWTLFCNYLFILLNIKTTNIIILSVNKSI